MHKKIIIFGAGETGQLAFDVFGEETVLCFADNYPKFDSYLGLPVIGFDELKVRYFTNPELCIVVASAFFAKEICKKLSENGILRYYIWPAAGRRDDDKLLEYQSICVFKDYDISKYENIAIYGQYEKLAFWLKHFLDCGLSEKIKFVIPHDDNGEIIASEYGYTIFPWQDFDEIKNSLDLLLLDISRDVSMLHDKVECNVMPFAVVNLQRFEKFVRSSEIERFKGKHSGERCFIVGNGSSIRFADLDVLHENKEITFGFNRVYRSFSKTLWRPDYYMTQDFRFVMQNAEEIYNMDVQYKFIADTYPPFWASAFSNGAIKFRQVSEPFVPNMPDFSIDFSAYCASSHTIVYSAMQFAAYMGFAEVYLIGVDSDYSETPSNNADYFIADYFMPGEKGGIIKPDRVRLGYEKAEICSRLNGFRIYNATRGGKVESFERVSIDELF